MMTGNCRRARASARTSSQAPRFLGKQQALAALLAILLDEAGLDWTQTEASLLLQGAASSISVPARATWPADRAPDS
jgi:hypothetical protein